jgi:hypothetical protein
VVVVGTHTHENQLGKIGGLLCVQMQAYYNRDGGRIAPSMHCMLHVASCAHDFFRVIMVRTLHTENEAIALRDIHQNKNSERTLTLLCKSCAMGNGIELIQGEVFDAR